MADIAENAFLILRIMWEQNMGRHNQTTNTRLRELAGLDDRAYQQADDYLHESRLIDGMFASDEGLPRFITSAGVDYVKREMEARLPLSLNAERVLRYITEVEYKPKPFEGSGMGVSLQQVETELHLSRDGAMDVFQELHDEGLVKCPVNDGKGNESSIMKWGAVSSPEGRKALKHNFRLPTIPATQIGAVFNGPVTANNLVNAINSQVQQTFNQTDPDAIRQAIEETLNSLADNIAGELELSQRITYLQSVDSLKKELQKPKPDPSVIHKLVSAISFANSLNGPLDLAIKVAPYVPVLYEGIKSLLKAVGVTI